MQKVTGIGGFFFRAKDPAALALWYRDTLGINLVPQAGDQPPWMTEAGVTVFAPFDAETDYFRTESQFMINFRVPDLDAMEAQVTAAGAEVTGRHEMEGIGRFIHIHDPEGNPIELWEPAAAPTAP